VGVTESGHEAGAAFEGHDEQRLETGGYALWVGGAGPVEDDQRWDLGCNGGRGPYIRRS
jgi:hypothetical protein